MSNSELWNLTMSTPIGEQKAELEFTRDASGAVSGVTRTDMEGEVPMLEPELKGNTLTWKSNATKPMKTTVKMTLTLDGDKATGTAKAGMFPGVKVNATRVR